jgi:hypothetical protein
MRNGLIERSHHCPPCEASESTETSLLLKEGLLRATDSAGASLVWRKIRKHTHNPGDTVLLVKGLLIEFDLEEKTGIQGDEKLLTI